MKSRRLWQAAILAGCLWLLIGCGTHKAVFSPITGQDIIGVSEGQTLIAPKDGWFLSDSYMNERLKWEVDNG